LNTVEFSGIGEPLLHKDFEKFASYARENYSQDRLRLGLVSNGSLLDSDKIDSLITHQFNYVWFSLNAATSATHTKIMPGLRFEQIVNSVRQLIDRRNMLGLKIPLVRVSFLVTRDNYFEAEQFIDLGESLRADSITIGCVDSVLEPEIRKQQGVARVEFEPSLERIEARARKNKRIGVVPRWVFWPEAYKPPNREGATTISCGNADSVFGVYFTSGEVTFCCYMAAEIERSENCLGNIHESSALDIWNGARAISFTKSMNDMRTAPDICKRCANFWNKYWS
jgi:MoaA/NifB/PqqE/SkfB family radical SAM enzyme